MATGDCLRLRGFGVCVEPADEDVLSARLLSLDDRLVAVAMVANVESMRFGLGSRAMSERHDHRRRGVNSWFI